MELTTNCWQGTYISYIYIYIYIYILYGSMGDDSNESTNHRNILKNFIFWQVHAYIDLYFTIFC